MQYGRPQVMEKASRIVISRSAGTIFRSPLPVYTTLTGFFHSGRYAPIGSVKRNLPSSYNIMPMT